MQATSERSAVPTAELGRLEQAVAGLAKRVLGRGVRALSRHRVDRTAYFALTHLAATGPVRTSDLAGLLELDLSTVSRQVRVLEGAGLLEREADPSDGRAHLLALSPEGRRALEDARRERHAVLDRALADWDDTDRHRLVQLVERLAHDVERTTTCSAPAHAAAPAPAPPLPQEDR